nr:immunoglobulin light chain junction region [Macaca mulatta]MPO06240.1 immunoglobulin light chain junction region [Macaca mulatta]MPO06351.1 immunoglobulin light chain junction region [Macaca mulatta]MPO06621.1 immunoglobulin light chain junction region [Macaca mulatta]MPO07079.1 immunoglobulin light chain junction region [Macaca mulatta]
CAVWDDSLSGHIF